jgi:hypothetical protein
MKAAVKVQYPRVADSIESDLLNLSVLINTSGLATRMTTTTTMVAVTSCLEHAHADLDLVDTYESYLAGQGLVAMQTCIPHGSRFSELSPIPRFVWMGQFC